MKKLLSLMTITCLVCIQTYAEPPYNSAIKPATTPQKAARAPAPPKHDASVTPKQTEANQQKKASPPPDYLLMPAK